MRELLEKLYDQHILDSHEAHRTMLSIMHGEVNSSQLAAFFSALRMRGVAVSELIGFRSALMQVANKVDLSEFNPIDLCGTGGDGKNTFNISTLSAFVVAACGVNVAKHGNYAVSSACWSSNVLESIGIKFIADHDKLQKQMEKTGICFLHAPLFHRSMKSVAPVRKELGIKTVFNLLGPLCNPCEPKVQYCGVYNLEVLRLYSYVAREIGKKLTIIHGLDGYDEISLTGRYRVSTSRVTQDVDPHDLGLETLDPSAIGVGQDLDSAVTVFKRVISGDGSPAQNSVVAANSAYAIAAARGIEVEFSAVRALIEEARAALESGRAYEILKRCLEIQDK